MASFATKPLEKPKQANGHRAIGSFVSAVAGAARVGSPQT
jgi:hypothetical protein